MTVQIKSWPFQERIVKLLWFGNVHMKQRTWRINIAFEDRNKLKWIDVPIGLFPVLRIGQYYSEGQPLHTQKDGVIDYVRIKNLRDGQLNDALTGCRPCNYYLYADPECLSQKLLTYSINGIRYHIPQVELIRALYAKYQFLANSMLRPGGLEFLIKDMMVKSNYIYLAFFDEIPQKLVSDKQFITHFTWLYSVRTVKESFESIYSKVYSQAVQTGKNLSKGHPLIMELPDIGPLNFQYRGKKVGQDVLIYEILGLDGISVNVTQIDYTHRSFKKIKRVSKPRKKLISKTPKEETYEVDREELQNTKQDTNQPVNDHDMTRMKFDYIPAIRRLKQGERKVNSGDTYIVKKGRGGSHVRQGSVNETVLGGKIQPLEFNTLELAHDLKGHGLDDFFKMIQYLQENYHHLSISMSTVYLPPGRKYSWLPDGRRRICAVVKVMQRDKQPFYVLEVGRADNKPLSTLLLKIQGTTDRQEEIIQTIIKGLVYNSGNWNSKQLEKLNYIKLKHSSKTVDVWAARMYQKIQIL
ncbi:Tn7-like element transposition protein TnsE [Bacillus alveayuensis]|uniref:Tn7-like element transposition protein TnsE n=1 Tax=Aeribacillus alveayuensis TaxID=279215 RepID=UPI0005D118E4|nr:Tn7-like element transposition protein TnsE [Bacillus alveayuensis]